MKTKHNTIIIIITALLITFVFYSCEKDLNINSDKRLLELFNTNSLEDYLKSLPEDTKEYIKTELIKYKSSKPLNIEYNGDFHKGNIETADFKIIEYFDYNCNHCKDLYEFLNNVYNEIPNNIYIESRHFPIDANCNRIVPHNHINNDLGSCVLARASIGAGFLEKYFDFKEKLFEYLNLPFNIRIQKSIQSLDIDKKVFIKKLNSESTKRILVKDINKGIELNITATPFIIWNEKKISSNIEVLKVMFLFNNKVTEEYLTKYFD